MTTRITKDDVHWFDPVFLAWQCDDMVGVLDGLETALNHFMPTEREAEEQSRRDAKARGKE